MPHWVIYHPPTVFQDVESKRALVKDITALYPMPSFYVIVNFIKTDPTDQWIAGMMAHERSDKPFIRIQIAHIHVNWHGDAKAYQNIFQKWTEALKPHTLDKGYDYEFHIDETDRRLWSINGLAPPEFRSEEEKVWMKAGRSLSEEEMKGMKENL